MGSGNSRQSKNSALTKKEVERMQRRSGFRCAATPTNTRDEIYLFRLSMKDSSGLLSMSCTASSCDILSASNCPEDLKKGVP